MPDMGGQGMKTLATDGRGATRTLLWMGVIAGVAAVLATHASGQTPRPGGGRGPQTALAQAGRVAEQQTGGRAREAEMERKQGNYGYEIKNPSKNKAAKVL